MKTFAIVLLMTGLLIVPLSACSGGGQGTEEAGGGPAAQAPESMSPAELGEAIGGVYQEAIEAVAAAMTDRPEPAVLRPKLETMKESYVKHLVELGRARAALGPGDRATVDSKVRLAITMVPSETFTAFADGQSHYLNQDRELANLIASFNVITQYADFDLLKKQAPDEAKRLGVG